MAFDTLEAESVNVCDLATQPAWQVRKKLDAGTIERYASIYRSEGHLPPLEIARIDGALFVVDGWHRLEAAKRAGVHRVDCKVVTKDPAEAMWRAAQANLAHGLTLKRGEHRAVLKAFIKAGKHRRGKSLLSYREIAKEAFNGVRGYTTVRDWIKKDFPKLAAQMSDETRRGEGGGALPCKKVTMSPALIAHGHLDSLLALLQGLREEDRKSLLQRMGDVLNPPQDHAFF